MVHCWQCGREAAEGTAHGTPVPICPDHGPQWELVRNAPVSAVLAAHDGRVLVGRRAHDPWMDHWELPGGFVEHGEHPAAAARREFLEEIGLAVVLTGLIAIDLSQTPSGTWLQHTVFCGEASGTPMPDEAEISDARWADPDDLPEPMLERHRRWIMAWQQGEVAALPLGC